MRTWLWAVGLGAIAWGCMAGAAFAQPEAKPDEPAPVPDAAAQPVETKDSFWFIGTSNYHLRLGESEKQIDKQLESIFQIFPNYKRPTTFKDWSDDFLLWDLWGGYGFDISRKWCWSIYGGGGAGTVPNRQYYYPLGIPLKLNADFTRVSLMLGTSVTWYPWDKPQKREGGFFKNLGAARPMFEMNIGYNHQISIGDARMSLPILGEAVHIKDRKDYDLFWASPRAGVEIPLTEATSFNALGGYLFFHDHAPEYNGYMFEFFIRHRF